MSLQTGLAHPNNAKRDPETDLLGRLEADVLDESEHSHSPQAVVQEPIHVLPLLFPTLPERSQPRARHVESVGDDVAVGGQSYILMGWVDLRLCGFGETQHIHRRKRGRHNEKFFVPRLFLVSCFLSNHGPNK